MRVYRVRGEVMLVGLEGWQSWGGEDILDGRGEGGRAWQLDGQEENRPGDETMKGAWGQVRGSHVAIRV